VPSRSGSSSRRRSSASRGRKTSGRKR
jgi:hypothetical protein